MYVGPIECPKCNLPIEDNVHFCPHCYTNAPASAPWNQGAWGNVAIIGAVAAALFIVDACTGTRIVPTIWNAMQANAAQ
jgi:hypothetical protein